MLVCVRVCRRKQVGVRDLDIRGFEGGVRVDESVRVCGGGGGVWCGASIFWFGFWVVLRVEYRVCVGFQGLQVSS